MFQYFTFVGGRAASYAVFWCSHSAAWECALGLEHFFTKRYKAHTGTSLVVQCLKVRAPNAGGPSLIPALGTRARRPQLRPSAVKEVIKKKKRGLTFCAGLFTLYGKIPPCLIFWVFLCLCLKNLSAVQETWFWSLSRDRNGNLLQYACLENSMYRGAWWATVHGAVESDTTERLFFLRLVHSTAAGHSLFYPSSAGRGQNSSTVAWEGCSQVSCPVPGARRGGPWGPVSTIIIHLAWSLLHVSKASHPGLFPLETPTEGDAISRSVFSPSLELVPGARCSSPWGLVKRPGELWTASEAAFLFL